MVVVNAIFGLAIIGLLLFFLFRMAQFFLVVAEIVWPAMLGIVGGILLWVYVNDNLGALFAVGCFVGQYFWLRGAREPMSTSRASLMIGKRRLYDDDGQTIGYIDDK